MKVYYLATTFLVLAAPAVLAAARSPAKGAAPIEAEYVEVRTASVFAGPCHFGSEVTTTGRDAIMAWHVQSGTASGVDVSGVNAVAIVHSSCNLGDPLGAKTFVLYIDTSATSSQAAALAAAIQISAHGSLGALAAVKQTGIEFLQDRDSFSVRAGKYAELTVRPLPNRACCTQPSLVWYKPLVTLTDRRVGYTVRSEAADSSIGVDWMKSGQNTAFYGKATISP